MESISELLQEAKPLYFERKRRHKQIRAAVFSIAVVCISFFSVMNFETGNFVANLNSTSDTSVISEEYGLPVDDYGLLSIY